MRYLVDVGNTKKEDFDNLIETEGFTVVSKYEPVAKLQKEVEQLGILLKEFKQSGISWDVFVFYMKGKGYSLGIIEKMMGDVGEFFKKLGIK